MEGSFEPDYLLKKPPFLGIAKRDDEEWEKKFLKLFLENEDPPAGGGGKFTEQFTLREIRDRLLQAGIIQGTGVISWLRLQYEVMRCHQINYYRGYYFRKVSQRNGLNTVYSIWV